MQVSRVSFLGKPNNYSKIDNVVSRSAQPLKEDFLWLKEQGVTDIINFRTMYLPALNFDEKTVVEDLGMKYHSIPSVTKSPTMENIEKFLSIIKETSQKNGKLHIHCKAGADRTGMYAFIYKSLKNIGTQTVNIKEWIEFGHNTTKYPNLIDETLKLIKKIKQ